MPRFYTGPLSVSQITGSSPYQGPIDVQGPAAGWWGLRAASNAAIGTNCVKLRESAGNTTQTFNSVAGGGLPLGSIITFANGANLFVDTLFDQSGNGNNMVQATLAAQPKFVLNQLNGLPAMQFAVGSPSLDVATTGTAPIVNSPYSVSCLFDCTSAPVHTDFLNLADTGSGGSTRVGVNSGAADVIVLDAGLVSSIQLAASLNAWFSVGYVSNGAASSLFVNGTDSGAQTMPVRNQNNGIAMGASDGTHDWTGFGMEAGIWATSSLNKSGLYNNQEAFYGPF